MVESLRELALQGRPLRGEYVVDVHGHLGDPRLFDVPVTDAGEVIRIMDRIGIDVLCVSHLESLLGDVRRGNDLLAEAVKSYRGRFLGYAVANPNDPGDVVTELDRCFGKLGMRGIKTHMEFHNYPPDGPSYRSMYDCARAHGRVPVLAHSLGDAPTTERILNGYPEVPFIIAHAGGAFDGRWPNDLIEVIGRCPNAYTDLASSLTYAGGLEALVEAIGVEKVLFGSDICYQQATHQIGTVLCARLAEWQKKRILGLNAAKLFGLKGLS